MTQGSQTRTLLLFLLLALQGVLATHALSESNEEQTSEKDSIMILHAVRDHSTRVPCSFNEPLSEKYLSDPDFSYINPKSTTIWEIIQNLLRRLEQLLLARSEGEVSPITVILALLFPIALFFMIRMFVRQRMAREKARRNRTIHQEFDELEQRIETTPFDQLLTEEEEAGRFRQSIRILYIHTLKNLAANGIITWHKEKTNIDYLDEIESPELNERLRYLIYLYNHIWYGEFPIEKNDYLLVKESFLHLPLKMQSSE